LAVFTQGGVIAPGQTLMDIVPSHKSLLMRARIAPEDAMEITVGQRAIVRLGAQRDRGAADLRGTLTRLSADRLVDPRTGIAFFSADIVIDEAARQRSEAHERHFWRAGTPVQVLLPLRPRTALQYALGPLLGVFWKSLRER
jgi:HlyD family secretion protein